MKDEDLFKEIESELFNKLEQLGERIKLKLIATTKSILRENKKVVTGNELKGIDGEVKRIGDAVLIEIFGGTFYDYYVHEGTKPHFPPLAPLRDWVIKKGLAERFNSRGNLTAIKKYAGREAMSDYWRVDRIARAIAWKIYRKGTTGLKFFDLALKQSESRIDEMISKFNLSAS